MAVTPPSTPPSPTSPPHIVANNDLSDVFSDSPPTTPAHTSIPSDIPRLRGTHATAGYRAGISTSKTQFLQPGFDEGYSLGAVFGLRIGYLLGALEGLSNSRCLQQERKDRIISLYKEAQEQLKMENIFSQEFWDKDGIWTYGVVTNGDEVTFQEVAEQHPVVQKWDATVIEQVKKAGVMIGRFEGTEWEAGRI